LKKVDHNIGIEEKHQFFAENFPNLVTLLSHCPHPLIFVNKLVCVVLVYSYFGVPRGTNLLRHLPVIA
jgi:hypothetical protein